MAQERKADQENKFLNIFIINIQMKKSELKQIIKEEISKALDEKRKIKMSGIIKEGKRKLELLKQSMKKEGYDI